MARTYQRKFLPDGSENPKYKPRPAHWARQGRSKGGKQKSLFERGKFIFVDGEGGDYDGAHCYQMLAASTGARIYNERGLCSIQCFDYLLKLGADNPAGIFCIFAGSYDGNFWMKDLPKEVIERIIDANGKFPIWWNNYGIRYIQRKCFIIQRSGDKKGLKIWDVYGFFQSSFVNAIKNWVPKFDKLELVIKGKELRKGFHGTDYDFMCKYNDAELEAGVILMNKLREGIESLGLKISSWHGAGAIATAFYKKYDCKKYFVEPPEQVLEASQYAYFGGRIEIGKVGRHIGKIYHYDINSAYPAAQYNLPDLSAGQWIRRGSGFDTRKTKNALTIALVEWDNIVNTEFCPFPYRSELQRKVLFPSHGKNWVWKPEVDAALKWKDRKYDYWDINIADCWEFVPDDPNFRPFEFIAEDYQTRQQIVAESKRSGVPNGAEKTIKLGLNSLYGKTCQKIGYDEKTGRKPPYHNLCYAGFITSSTRSKLFDAAMQAPGDIIALATDGIYSLSELDLDCPVEKILGAWERQTHDEMMIVQAGFYFLRDSEKLTSYSRGFDKMITQSDMFETRDMILSAWAKNKHEVFLPCTRFITLKSALISDNWWARWCTWYKYVTPEGIEGRRLATYPSGTKRRLTDSKTRADKQMLQTMPEYNLSAIGTMSELHSLPWDSADDDFDMEAILEHDIDSMC